MPHEGKQAVEQCKQKPKKDVLSLMAEPGRLARAVDQMLKEHPKLTQEEALARLKAAGL